MEYTNKEKQVLDLMQRTDFKAISKNDVINIASKIDELRPEVASQIITQFPEFSGLVKAVQLDYKEELSTIIDSDDSSLNRFYDIADQELNDTETARNEFYDFAEEVRGDLSKCLDDEAITPEERLGIIDREMELFKIVDKKENEIREEQNKIIDIADKKDSEKRAFDWSIVKVASYVVMIGLGIGLTALGGKMDLKLPDFKG